MRVHNSVRLIRQRTGSRFFTVAVFVPSSTELRTTLSCIASSCKPMLCRNFTMNQKSGLDTIGLLRKDENLTVRIVGDLKARLKAEAKRQDRSLAWLVEKYLEAGLRREHREGKKDQ